MTSISALDFRRFIEKVEQRKYIQHHLDFSDLFLGSVEAAPGTTTLSSVLTLTVLIGSKVLVTIPEATVWWFSRMVKHCPLSIGIRSIVVN